METNIISDLGNYNFRFKEKIWKLEWDQKI